MVLKKNEHNALHDQFGDGYLCKALVDLRKYKQNSKTHGILVGDPHIGNDASDIRQADSLWDRISDTLKQLYGLSLEAVKNIAWKTLVQVGNVPAFLETLIRNLGRMAYAAGNTLIRLANKIGSVIGTLWEYIASLFDGSSFELSGSQRSALEQAKQESFNFLTLVSGTARAVWIGVIRKLAAGILKVLMGLRSIIFDATKNMTALFTAGFDAFVSLPSVGYASVKRYAVETGFTIMLQLMDFNNTMSNQPDSNVRARSDAMACQFRPMVSSMTSNLKRIPYNIINDLVVNSYIYKAGYSTILAARNAVRWIISHLGWLADIINSFRETAYAWFTSLFTLSPAIGKLFGQWFSDVATGGKDPSDWTSEDLDRFEAGTIGSTKNALEELSKDTSIPAPLRKEMADAASTTQDVFNEFREYERRRISALNGLNDKDTFRDINVAARNLTAIFMGEDPNLEEIDSLILNRTGFTTGQRFNIIDNAHKLMELQLVRGVLAKLDAVDQGDEAFLSLIGNGQDKNENDGGRKTEDILEDLERAQNQLAVFEKALVQEENRVNLRRDAIYTAAAVELDNRIGNQMAIESGREPAMSQQMVIRTAEAYSDLVADMPRGLQSTLTRFLVTRRRVQELAKELKARQKTLKQWHFNLVRKILLITAGGAAALLLVYFGPGFVNAALASPEEPTFWGSIGGAADAVWNYGRDWGSWFGVLPFDVTKAFNPMEYIRVAGSGDIPTLGYLAIVLKGTVDVASAAGHLFFSAVSGFAWYMVDGVYDGRGVDAWTTQWQIFKQTARQDIAAAATGVGTMAFNMYEQRATMIAMSMNIGKTLLTQGPAGLLSIAPGGETFTANARIISNLKGVKLLRDIAGNPSIDVPSLEDVSKVLSDSDGKEYTEASRSLIQLVSGHVDPMGETTEDVPALPIPRRTKSVVVKSRRRKKKTKTVTRKTPVIEEVESRLGRQRTIPPKPRRKK